MVFKNSCIPVLWRKVVSALKGLNFTSFYIIYKVRVCEWNFRVGQGYFSYFCLLYFVKDEAMCYLKIFFTNIISNKISVLFCFLAIASFFDPLKFNFFFQIFFYWKFFKFQFL